MLLIVSPNTNSNTNLLNRFMTVLPCRWTNEHTKLVSRRWDILDWVKVCVLDTFLYVVLSGLHYLFISSLSVADNPKKWYDWYWVEVVFMFQLDLLPLTWLQVLFIVTVTLHLADQGSCFSKVGSYDKTLHRIKHVTIWIPACSVIWEVCCCFFVQMKCVCVCTWPQDKLRQKSTNSPQK